MFSGIKSFIGNAYNTVKSAVSGIGSALTSPIGKNQTANALGAMNFPLLPGASLSTNKPAPTPTGISGTGTTYYNNYVPSAGSYIPSNASVGGAGFGPYGPQLPVSITAGPTKKDFSFRGGSSGGYGASGSFDTAAASFAPQTRTISSTSLGGSTGVGTSSFSNGAGTSSVVLPSAPSSVSPKMDNTALAGRVAGLYQLKPDGTLEEVKQEETPVGDKIKERTDIYEKYLGVKPSVYEDPEVQQARQQKQRIQESLRAPTAELNAVVAQQNADLLNLRKIGSKEGVTETVYGNQEKDINYNAAIRALPLKASISALQGDLQLAQDYLTELTQIKTDQINRQYEYNKALFSSITGVLDKEDERAYNKMTKANDRAYEMEKNLIALKQKVSLEVLEKGGSANTLSRINNAKNDAEVFAAAGNYAQSSGNGVEDQLYKGLTPQTATAVRGQTTAFKSEPLVQNFATIQEGYNFAKSLSNKTKNPADDQALIYSLAKTLDPGSVVREGEYATAQKYAQSWVKAYGKGVTQAIAGTGFLSEDARKNIKATIESKYKASKASYDTIRNSYVTGINDLTGRQDGSKFIRDYRTEASTSSNDPLGLGIGQPSQSNPLGI